MKTKIILILAMFTVCFSCKKDVETTDSNEILEIFEFLPNSNVIGTKTIGNGKSGTFKSLGGGVIHGSTKKGYFSLDITSYNASGDLREIISMGDIPIKKGNFPILIPGWVENDDIIDVTYSRTAADGDVLVAYYLLNETQFSNIEITDIDTVANYVRGKLNVHFVMQGKSGIADLPNKVSFTSVNFDMKLFRR